MFCPLWKNISLRSCCLFHFIISQSVSYKVSKMDKSLGVTLAYLSVEVWASQKRHDWLAWPWRVWSIKWLISSYLSQHRILEKVHVYRHFCFNYCHLRIVFPGIIILLGFLSCHFFPSLQTSHNIRHKTVSSLSFTDVGGLLDHEFKFLANDRRGEIYPETWSMFLWNSLFIEVLRWYI